MLCLTVRELNGHWCLWVLGYWVYTRIWHQNDCFIKTKCCKTVEGLDSYSQHPPPLFLHDHTVYKKYVENDNPCWYYLFKDNFDYEPEYILNEIFIITFRNTCIQIHAYTQNSIHRIIYNDISEILFKVALNTITISYYLHLSNAFFCIFRKQIMSCF